MDEERPAKTTIRDLWMEHLAAQQDGWDEETPLYLTLCGAEGRDIQAAIDAGIVAESEVGGISPDDLDKCIAVERSPEAVLRLQRRHPGLKILQQDVADIVSGDSLLSWPGRDRRSVCRAKVLNLDLNSKFGAREDGPSLRFPIAAWIHKLARMHDVFPPLDWSVYLTVNARIDVWTDAVWSYVLRVLSSNVNTQAGFRDGLESLVGPVLVSGIEDQTCLKSTLAVSDAQGVVMALVPKIICQEIPDGWMIDVVKSIRYGGESNEIAPMVMFIIDFRRDDGLTGLKDVSYAKSVGSIFDATGAIDPAGALAIT